MVLETKELLIELRSLLDSEQSKDSAFRSQYYTEALNYLNRFWNKIFAFLNDGELPIDNNLAKRSIRKFTTQRNNSLHYGSDAGAEMAATYHSVIETVKLHGSSIWNFIGTFFKKIFIVAMDFRYSLDYCGKSIRPKFMIYAQEEDNSDIYNKL